MRDFPTEYGVSIKQSLVGQRLIKRILVDPHELILLYSEADYSAADLNSNAIIYT